jgi:hypothetical protein
LVDGVAVEARLESSADAGILAQRIVGFGSVGEVHRDALVAELHSLAELELGIVAH